LALLHRSSRVIAGLACLTFLASANSLHAQEGQEAQPPTEPTPTPLVLGGGVLVLGGPVVLGGDSEPVVLGNEPMTPLRTAEAPAAPVLAAQPPEKSTVWSFLGESTPTLNLRTRAEFADQQGLKKAVAYTARARLGVRTREFKGLQLFAELEHNEVIGNPRFNAAGVDGPPDRSLIADPQSTELNQAFLSYSAPRAEFKIGRQNIILGEGLFVGDIGFRQNGQSFDAISVTAKPTEGLELFYSYIYNVNRLFGSTKGRDMNFDSRSHLVQATYRWSDLLTARAFGYLFDLQAGGMDGRSANMLGISFTGSQPVSSWLFSYRADLAQQQDAASNPVDFRANYLFVSGSVAKQFSRAGVELSAGRERFGSDGNTGFQNTLDVTYLDLFLATPANGLTRDFVQLSALLPKGFMAQVIYNDFRSATDSDGYGQQVTGIVRRELTKGLAVVARAFTYRDDEAAPMGGPPVPPDTFRYSLQLDFQFN
jgi:hypothetical protein